MPDSAASPLFTLSYLPKVEDVAELISVGARKSRRAASTGIISALVLIAIVLIALMAHMGQDDGSGPAPVER